MTMKVAVMQPYFFPYLGYWQLMRLADVFVMLDDVNYIKAGWVNRNRLLLNGRPSYLTMPVRDASQNRKICETHALPAAQWCDKTLKTIAVTYRRAPHFSSVFPFLERIIRQEATNLSDYLGHQLSALAVFMGIDTALAVASRDFPASDVTGQTRILDICRQCKATVYLNLPGGQALYDPAAFAEAGIELRFVAMRPLPYPQRVPGFIPALSIIDALMELGQEGIRPYLSACDLVEKNDAPMH